MKGGEELEAIRSSGRAFLTQYSEVIHCNRPTFSVTGPAGCDQRLRALIIYVPYHNERYLALPNMAYGSGELPNIARIPLIPPLRW